jgi:hypothetical protein
MAWIKVPREHHPLFYAALPKDPRVETQLMFGGVAAKVHGHIFAGLFGRSAIVLLDEADRAEALALDGAGPFDPMGDGRARSDKIMLPEDVFHDPAELRQWIGRAFAATAMLAKKTKPATKPTRPAATKTSSTKTPTARKPATNKPATKLAKKISAATTPATKKISAARKQIARSARSPKPR